MIAPAHTRSGERRRVRAAVRTGNELVNPWSTSALASPVIGWRGDFTPFSSANWQALARPADMVRRGSNGQDQLEGFRKSGATTRSLCSGMEGARLRGVEAPRSSPAARSGYGGRADPRSTGTCAASEAIRAHLGAQRPRLVVPHAKPLAELNQGSAIGGLHDGAPRANCGGRAMKGRCHGSPPPLAVPTAALGSAGRRPSFRHLAGVDVRLILAPWGVPLARRAQGNACPVEEFSSPMMAASVPSDRSWFLRLRAGGRPVGRLVWYAVEVGVVAGLTTEPRAPVFTSRTCTAALRRSGRRSASGWLRS